MVSVRYQSNNYVCQSHNKSLCPNVGIFFDSDECLLVTLCQCFCLM